MGHDVSARLDEVLPLFEPTAPELHLGAAVLEAGDPIQLLELASDSALRPFLLCLRCDGVLHVGPTCVQPRRVDRQVAKETLIDLMRPFVRCEGLFRISGEGVLIRANPTLARILGFDSTEALLADYRDLLDRVFLKKDRAQELMRQQRDWTMASAAESLTSPS